MENQYTNKHDQIHKFEQRGTNVPQQPNVPKMPNKTETAASNTDKQPK